MNITLRQAAEAFPAIQKLAERELSLQIAWKLAQALDVIKAHIDSFQRATKKRSGELGIIEPLPKDVDEETKEKRILAINAFNAEAEDLLDSTTIDMPDHQFQLSDFGESPIKAEALVGIKFLIKE